MIKCNQKMFGDISDFDFVCIREGLMWDTMVKLEDAHFWSYKTFDNVNFRVFSVETCFSKSDLIYIRR